MIAFDGHVHFYSCFDQAAFLDAALKNFKNLAACSNPARHWSFLLLLAEQRGQREFTELLQAARAGRACGSWQLTEIEKDLSLRLVHEDKKGHPLFLCAGRQLVTCEGLEVLALMTSAECSHGLDLGQTIAEVQGAGGVAVCPWGAGKWLGKRGRLLEAALQKTPPGFFLGDSGGRPAFWHQPQFAGTGSQGQPVISGSDPLPLAQEERRAGSFGGIVERELDRQRPAASLKGYLEGDGCQIASFGRPCSMTNFVKTQLALRLRKDGM